MLTMHWLKGLSSKLIIEEDGVHSGTNGKMFAKKNLDIMTNFIVDHYNKSKELVVRLN